MLRVSYGAVQLEGDEQCPGHNGREVWPHGERAAASQADLLDLLDPVLCSCTCIKHVLDSNRRYI